MMRGRFLVQAWHDLRDEPWYALALWWLIRCRERGWIDVTVKQTMVTTPERAVAWDAMGRALACMQRGRFVDFHVVVEESRSVLKGYDSEESMKRLKEDIAEVLIPWWNMGRCWVAEL